MDKNNNTLTTVGVFMLGIMTGLVVNMWMNPEKIRHMMEKRKRFKRMWGEGLSPDKRRTYQEIKNRIIEKLTDLQISLEDIDESKYIKIVQDTMREIQKKLTLPDKEAERFQNYFEKSYDLIRKELG